MQRAYAEREGNLMRVLLYTHHSLFEPALCLAAALAERAEVHLLLEVPAGQWQLANFEVAQQQLPTGLIDANAVLAPHYPAGVRAAWQGTASFHLVVPGRFRARDPRSVRQAGRILGWIRELDPDVMHLDDVDVSPRLALALAGRRTPHSLVVGCHDPDPHSGERRWRLKLWVRKLVLPRADAVVVHHRSGATALRRRHPRLRKPVRVVHLGAYTFLQEMADQPERETPRSRPTILLFGRITPYKGLEQLYRVAPVVASAVSDLRVVVAGNPVRGYEPPPVPSLENGGQVETRFEYVPAHDTPALFAEADVVVCPYTDASQSGVVLTAFALGRPVVVTNVGGLAEYVEDGTSGIVVPAGDDEQLADALIRCLRDPELAGHLTRGVVEAVEGRLSWARAAAELLGVYEQAVTGSGRARGWVKSQRSPGE